MIETPAVGARTPVFRRALRSLGTILLVVGVAFLAWAFVVWRWNDPITGVYTRYEQHKLSRQYEQKAQSFASHVPAVPAPTVAAERRRIEAAARRYRALSPRGAGIGRISVPRLGLNMVLVNGTDHESLKRGPGRDLRTYMPGQGELVYIAGHRTTYLAPFAHIERLQPGDPVSVEVPYGTFRYRVLRHVIVPAGDVSRLRSHGREEVVLQACHPRFFATQRYLVYAKLVRVVPIHGRPFAAG